MRPTAKRMKIDTAVLHVFANVELRIEISSDGHPKNDTAHPKNEADPAPAMRNDLPAKINKK
jgi:hypothetical protein